MMAAKLADLKEELPELIYPDKNNFSLLKLLVGDGGNTIFGWTAFLQPILSYEWSVAQ
jgi:hypothetical protein